MDDKSGIYSLGGFAYQILVLGLFIPEMRNGDEISFETIDDVETSLRQEELDGFDNVVRVNSLSKISGHSSIQVKKTDINTTKAAKIIKNWMITEITYRDIDNYVLYTDRKNTSLDLFDSVSIPKIVDEILAAKEKPSSINMRLKSFECSASELEEICKRVVKKSEIKIFDDFEEEIKKSYERFFFSSAVTTYVYVNRLRDFLSEIAAEILECVINAKAYTLNYEHVEKLQNRVITSITDECIEPSYANFRKLNKINLSDLAISNSREYKQLCECNLEDSAILRNLIYGEYYADCKFGYYEAGKQTLVDDIEVTAYENFCETKDQLQLLKEDTPRNRLDKTKEMSNENAKNKQIRYGACIGLTKDNVDPGLQISWKD